MNKETLEEAAERLYPTTIDSFTDSGIDLSERDRIIFTNGAKHQQEQDKNKYSEEDLDAFRKFMIQEQNFSKSCLDVFVKLFKKK